jgi:predicted metal-dependent hydrolase
MLDKLKKMLRTTAAPPRKMQSEIHVAGYSLPVEIIRDRNNGIRYSMTARKVILRVPTQMTDSVIREHLPVFRQWVEKTIQQRPELLRNYIAPTYESGSTLTVGQYQYTLDVVIEDREDHAVRLHPNRLIQLRLSSAATQAQRTKSTRKLLAKAVGAHQKAAVTRRVLEINQATVQRPIKSVTLKYNSSNWGSCSSKSNINLSVRLLFAPQEVQDYVILHELAHLIEQNHSDRFWAIVEQYMPDYQRHELWLKEHGKDCEF